MSGHDARDYWEDRGLVLLWTAALAGPLAFGLNLQVGYALVKWACSRNQTFVLPLVAAVTFALTAAGAWIAWSCLVKVRGVADEQGGRIVDRSYFMAVVSIGVNLLSALLIATSAYHPVFLSPCE